MTEQDKINTIVELLVTYKGRIPQLEWATSVRGWGIYFSKRSTNFDVNEFYDLVGY